MPQANLDADLQPLKDWLTEQTRIIVIVIGDGPGARVAKTQIRNLLAGAPGDYENVGFGMVNDAATLTTVLTAAGIIDYDPYTLISISAHPKKMISTVKDTELIGMPGWVQQAIVEAEGT